MSTRHAVRPLASLHAILLVVALGVTSACGGGDDAAGGVTVDTLPGGIPRTVSARPVEAGRWSLVLARELQPAEGDPAELLNPRDLALAEDGSLVITDTKPERIKVFGADGTFRRAIGRDGGGPGEYEVAYIGIRGDSLVVHDPSGSRGTTFDWRTGSLLAERRTACCYWSPVGIDGTGRAWARSIVNHPDTTKRNVQAFARFALAGTDVDTLFALERQDVARPASWVVREGTNVRMAMLVPLAPRAVFAVDPTAGLVTGWSAEYLLRRSRDGIDTVALFGRTMSPAPVAASEKTRIAEERIAEQRRSNPNGPTEPMLRAAFDPTMIPDAHPAYETFTVDRAGRTWVRLAQPDTTIVAFDLFDRDGRWLDALKVPAAGWPKDWWAPVAWSTREAAVILEGADGRPLVRVYSIVRQ